MQIPAFLSKFGASVVLFVSLSFSVHAAELLMIEQPYCPYCDQFKEEIGDMYAKTDEGKTAPLLQLQLDESWPAKYAHIEKPDFTPTFILVHEGQEVDRIYGYQGDEFFWFLLGEILEKLDS